MKRLEACRICNGSIIDVFSLGLLYPSGFTKTRAEWPQKHPLTLCQCEDCELVQLRYEVPLDSMYRQYWYRSGLNTSMVTDLEDVVRSVESFVVIEDGDTVVDIGCNDGTLFDFYTKDVVKIGYDPALNLGQAAIKHCNVFINDYFYITDHWEDKFEAKVITAIAMFYDLPDPVAFLEDIKKILHPEGIFVIQFTDLYSMFSLVAFDNICHEHLEYYSLNVLDSLFRSVGLKILDIQYNAVNGGSVRVYVGWPDYFAVSTNVRHYLTRDSNFFSGDCGEWEIFNYDVTSVKHAVTDWLYRANQRGDMVVGLGASTKGNTLLQYFNIDETDIPFILEVNEDKFGLVTVGSNISIINEHQALEDGIATHLFVLPWHFQDSFLSMPHLQKFMHDGGKLVFPLPIPTVFSCEEGYILCEYMRSQ